MHQNNDENPTILLTQELIRKASITPNDEGCQDFLAKRLQSIGFTIEHLPFGEVHNLWAKRGHEGPLIIFAGHTDVVPTGPLTHWISPPFEPTLRDGRLYGRGAADMKGGLAAMLVAAEKFIHQFPHHKGSIAFLLTSDEEGPGIDGTRYVINYLNTKNEQLTYCIVGEPSSEKQLGDTVKIGRRGSLNGKLKIQGKQGHIAYPQLADNPIHAAFLAIGALCQEVWDTGNEFFPATCLQFSNVQAGTGVTNVIPNDLEAMFNFRYSPEITETEIKRRVTDILDRHLKHYEIDWTPSSAFPFLSQQGKLSQATKHAVQKILGITPKFSTDGGTSDARFIAPTGCEVLELGLTNGTIHQINENVLTQDLILLTEIYQEILKTLLT